MTSKSKKAKQAEEVEVTVNPEAESESPEEDVIGSPGTLESEPEGSSGISIESQLQELQDKYDKLTGIVTLLAQNTGWSSIVRKAGLELPPIDTKKKYG